MGTDNTRFAVLPGMTDSLDRQALLDAGLDPDDPRVWETQRRVRNLLAWCGTGCGWRIRHGRAEYRGRLPDLSGQHG